MVVVIFFAEIRLCPISKDTGARLDLGHILPLFLRRGGDLGALRVI
jgi:hypothetical protein